MGKVVRIFDSATEADGLLDMQLTPESLNSNDVEDHASSLYLGGLLLSRNAVHLTENAGEFSDRRLEKHLADTTSWNGVSRD
jgi:hypothetical protein